MAITELDHVAEAGGFRFELRDRDGRRVPASPRLSSKPEIANAAVEAQANRIGEVVVAPRDELLLRSDRELQGRLNRLHLVSGLVALGVGLLAASVFSASLVRPLRRLTASARRIERGRLSERPPRGGGAEIDQLAQALNRLADTLQREEELRREAVADVAHELRTPVSGILARIEAAQDGVLPDERGNLDAMHAEARRLATLIADLERLAAAERPGLTLQKERLDLATLVGQRADAFVERFAAAGIRFERQLEPAYVEGEAARLEQVIDNLLSNALRFTDREGTVTLSLVRDGSEAVLQVADTGIGVDPEALDRVFERFWRADPSRSRATGGAGIGLAIVRELVRAHQGRVEVESSPGEGSVFRVALPVAAGASSAAPAKASVN
jgi:signal transduction histidine kinase